ncbi:DctP family TRAP transporter solute-binding subunit [Brevibacillus ruminantium]|uniref:DctP family TRAP transporter solute-binding subunit n=1 Tax=Brevibacillus ruminantium TaxID=2950604 RepID=A0ABY4WI54_9BACL|nr:DctP family TRAP transporter solute-binding subunit [Brevibacillus ruminantium]USG66787.1 DctP family TRAP transporter solute-binding subunit [Brevibacillus ruminantium]
MKKKWVSVLATVGLMGSLLAGCGGAPAAQNGTAPQSNTNNEGGATTAAADEYEKATIRLAYNLPQDHHISKGIEEFAKKVTERSGGNVKVQVYPAGQLLSDKEMNQAILTGGVEMGVNSSTLWASVVPAMGIFDVPYAIPTSYELAGKALNGPVGDKLKAEMEAKGAKVLLFADYGYAQFANSARQLTKPEDFQGLKIRSIGHIPSAMIQAYGAAPVFMGAGEVYMALQRKTIDGATSGTTAMVQRKYDEVSKYLTICNYAYLEFVLAVNKKYWDGLPPKTQELVAAAAKETEDWIRTQAEQEDKATAEQLKQKGMDVYIVPDSDLPAWKEAAKPAWEEYVKTAGDLGKELLEDMQNIK